MLTWGDNNTLPIIISSASSQGNEELLLQVLKKNIGVIRWTLADIQVLKRCEKTNLVLDWGKCQFMVTRGIALGHKISKAELEVGQANIDAIAKLPTSTNIKALQNFLQPHWIL